MNKDIIKGHWKELKGQIKQQWGKITDDDLTQLEGSYDELEGLLQRKYGYQKDEAEKAISDFVSKYEEEETY